MSDLISRQDAIKAITGEPPEAHYPSWYAEQVKALPPAQSERKRGRWRSDRLLSTNGGTYGVRRCSVCEAYYQDIGYGWNFCPNCGAEMEGAEWMI